MFTKHGKELHPADSTYGKAADGEGKGSRTVGAEADASFRKYYQEKGVRECMNTERSLHHSLMRGWAKTQQKLIELRCLNGSRCGKPGDAEKDFLSVAGKTKSRHMIGQIMMPGDGSV